MAKDEENDRLSAEPVKEFFVDMLTRDIELADAILDLLDNCVDGVVRAVGKQGLKQEEPYKDYFARIKLSSSKFVITDNCGGIPDDRKSYAFRMGAPPGGRDLHLPTVGTYGIGMKRAMFKLGRNCLVETKTAKEAYSVAFPISWFNDPNDWFVKVNRDVEELESAGTRITVSALRDGVKNQLGHDGFIKHLREQIATHYALIIAKGFTVEINGDAVVGKPITLRFNTSKKGILPFIFETKRHGVDVFLTVGFTLPIPSETEANSDTGAMSQGMYQSAEAGWSVICNDRTVVYADKTALTGWGEYPVPRYHNQFIAISGIVEFRSDEASMLPMTTTKRGIDASSELYLEIKQMMREGMKVFTDFTNKWKGPKLASEGKEMIREAQAMSLPEIKKHAKALTFRAVRRKSEGRQFRPTLPTPPSEDDGNVRIAFSRPRTDVATLADRFFGDSKTTPSLVGEKCFDTMLHRTR